jgi:hypothetical protein
METAVSAQLTTIGTQPPALVIAIGGIIMWEAQQPTAYTVLPFKEQVL